MNAGRSLASLPGWALVAALLGCGGSGTSQNGTGGAGAAGPGGSSSVGNGGAADGGAGGATSTAASSSATGLPPNKCPKPAPSCPHGDDADIPCDPDCGEVPLACADICNGGPPSIALGLGTTRIRVPSAAAMMPSCCAAQGVAWSMVFEPPAGHCVAVYGPTTALIKFGPGSVDRCSATPAECLGATSNDTDARAIVIALPVDGVPVHGSIFTIDVTSAPCAAPDCSVLNASCNGDGAP